ncbi:MAG: hypothetical protein JXR25_11865 [Pontiellaceae bacterium]|nr:hypothetical protein [Pontiellaceae bacterium]
MTGDPGWVAYLNEPLFAGSPQTRGEWLCEHGTVEVTANMFLEFRRLGGSAPTHKSTMPKPENIEGQVEPVATVSSPSDSGKPRYRRESIHQFRKDVEERRIPYTAETQQLLREYQFAELEGRVE